MEGVLDLVKKSCVFPQVIISNKFYIWHDKFYIWHDKISGMTSFVFSNKFYTWRDKFYIFKHVLYMA